MKSVAKFRNMAELRVEIDTLDRDIVALLARRAALIDRAVELKPAENLPARIDTRVEVVVDNVRVQARRSGLDADLVETLWRHLIQWSIRREEVTLGKTPP